MILLISKSEKSSNTNREENIFFSLSACCGCILILFAGLGLADFDIFSTVLVLNLQFSTFQIRNSSVEWLALSALSTSNQCCGVKGPGDFSNLNSGMVLCLTRALQAVTNWSQRLEILQISATPAFIVL